MKSRTYVKCKIGYWELVEENGKITALDFIGELAEDEKEMTTNTNPILDKGKKQLEEYFNGRRQEFSLPIHLEGTAFQKRVWQALQEIPYGTTKSYQEVAENVGNKNSVRAVGGANNRNPISIIVPCHRVIGKDGTLVGYGGGLDVKAFLLKLEATR
ncbi:MAG: methylated-DNA--[protein]-cysteine S-methyltransferase [Anaerovoracaceae bacterium]|jgi:methylated-DNA-[protein]-cysteine S-methyltransferase|nr:methylated-DNA--[protein]-cysteine S-methyltransferase [Anaerovoracaceae bacterium]